ncbi:hypothetical protein L1987_08449 [Smallanthus sonchifolius]|uniref:Uncharacterized protein n=1 Tax=Smallanthus sonchifolius TaxID=185202 RepID=A0ACB9JK76_9ASTR|nr:hypothetical protein L1987_08449 [Smallanthus sonchifolius]
MDLKYVFCKQLFVWDILDKYMYVCVALYVCVYVMSCLALPLSSYLMMMVLLWEFFILTTSVRDVEYGRTNADEVGAIYDLSIFVFSL